MTFLQPFLRSHRVDALSAMKSFRYGRSVTNQASEYCEYTYELTAHGWYVTENRIVVVLISEVDW